MKFNTPAFVRVENPQERKDLIDWARAIGHTKWASSNTCVYAGCHIGINAINCDTNIPLFKSLAAMNSKNDHEQWFITNNDEWFVSGYDKQHRHACTRTINGVKIGVRTARKATAEEIINHFKNKKS